MGPECNARLKKYLVRDQDRKDILTMDDTKKFLIEGCYFQYLSVGDMRYLGQLEGLLCYLLDVQYIYKVH